jgi:hypothetical protein
MCCTLETSVGTKKRNPLAVLRSSHKYQWQSMMYIKIPLRYEYSSYMISHIYNIDY